MEIFIPVIRETDTQIVFPLSQLPGKCQICPIGDLFTVHLKLV